MPVANLDNQVIRPHSWTSTQLKKTSAEGDAISQGVGYEDCRHEVIDSDDACYNLCYDGVYDQLWPHDQQSYNTSAALGCAIGRTQGAGDHGRQGTDVREKKKAYSGPIFNGSDL